MHLSALHVLCPNTTARWQFLTDTLQRHTQDFLFVDLPNTGSFGRAQTASGYVLELVGWSALSLPHLAYPALVSQQADSLAPALFPGQYVPQSYVALSMATSRLACSLLTHYGADPDCKVMEYAAAQQAITCFQLAFPAQELCERALQRYTAWLKANGCVREAQTLDDLHSSAFSAPAELGAGFSKLAEEAQQITNSDTLPFQSLDLLGAWVSRLAHTQSVRLSLGCAREQ